MSKIPTFFVRSCGVCGRTLRIPVSLLGELVTCEHCRATFVADDRNHRQPVANNVAAEFGQRLDMLLAAAHNQRNRGSTCMAEDDSSESSARSDVPSSEQNR